jgi:nucleotide-binding universal stress UspA family protein
MQTTFRRILVPYDFSTPARRALETAVDLAAARRGRLVVLLVITPVYAGEVGYTWFPEGRLLDDTRRQLAEIVTRVTKRRGVPADCRVEIGTPVERIMDAARRADVIVMSTMGRTGLSRMLLGSVAERVVRHSPVPVLTIRGKAGARARGRAPARRRSRRKTAR